jgi:hypothetical protein
LACQLAPVTIAFGKNQNGSPVYLAFPFSQLLKMKARLCDPFCVLAWDAELAVLPALDKI